MPFTPQNFVDKVGPAIKSSWLNALDVTANFVLGGAQTVAAALTALGLPSGGIPTPMTIALGGTSSVTGLNVVFTGTDSGAVNAYVISAPGLPALTNGLLVQFTPLHTNTGAATINTVAVVNQQGVALTGGELSSLGPVVVEYVSAMPAWQIVSTAGAQPGFSITPAEIAAGVTPTNYQYPPGNVLRYGADPSGVASSLVAFNSMHAAAMAASPHTPMYVPAGTYKIPNPGLSWTDALDLRMYGDGPEQTLLTGDTTSYTILTISNDHGGGTTGSYLNLSNFGIKNNPLAAGQHALSLADYNYVTVSNMVLFSSGNTLVMAGMANYTMTNLNILTWNSNSAGNAGLVLKADTLGIFCGPGVWNACQIEGSGSVTTGGAIQSTGTFANTFIATQIEALGPALVSVVELASKDDFTLIDCYTESCANTTNNTAVMFYLGRTLAPINFTVIGGTFNSGDGAGHFCNYGILGYQQGPMLVSGAIWNNFTTAAMNFSTSGISSVTILNTTAAGGGATVVTAAVANAPAGGTVQFWTGPAQTSSWGTPAGPAVVANFPAIPTLAECGAAIGQIIVDMKKRGQYGG